MLTWFITNQTEEVTKKYKITIEATEEAGNSYEVEKALNELNLAFGDMLISWKEGEEA